LAEWPPEQGRPLLIGSIDVVRKAAAICDVALEFRPCATLEEAEFGAGIVPVLDPGGAELDDMRFGQVSDATARASFKWLLCGQQLAQGGQLAGLVIGPMDSIALKKVGISMDGPDFEPPDTFQLRLSGALRVVPITEHIRTREITSYVKQDLILKLIRLLDSQLKQWGIVEPRIGVAGVNPHAAYEEEKQEIAPAIAAAHGAGIQAEGPISPDSIFRMALEGRFDAVVTMFHDQGQIAVKTVGFAGACTVFLGLPYIRIGIPHGTAVEIAGTGRAQHLSMLAAIRTAAALADGRLSDLPS
jgi:4-hydroxythreonine-4-phosphate dehydrogenase